MRYDKIGPYYENTENLLELNRQHIISRCQARYLGPTKHIFSHSSHPFQNCIVDNFRSRSLLLCLGSGSSKPMGTVTEMQVISGDDLHQATGK